jgi:hypothetical protein
VDTPWERRLKVLGWVNLSLGLGSPLRMGYHIVSALRVFRYSWCAQSILLLLAIGTLLGALTGASGWGLLKRRPWARKVTLIAGGLTLGYCGLGVGIMLLFGISGDLVTLIRNHSLNWEAWSLSHFESPAFLEIPWTLWWILCLCLILSHPEPRNSKGLLTQPSPAGVGWVISCALLGGVMRWVQFGVDMVNYSQR